jgi:hypothetical protein
MAVLIFGLEEQLVITFLFMLSIVFGALRISNVLKSGPASFLLSLAVAAFAALSPFSATLWTYMPSLTWFFIIVFLIAFVFEMFGVRKKEGGGGSEAMVVNAAILLVLLTLGWRIAQTFNMQIPYIGTSENLIFLLGFVFIISILWSAMKTGVTDMVGPPAKK